jgi:MraZ protein
MLIGEFHKAVDSGGLVIPPRLCAKLGDQVTLTRGIERCVLVYPAEAWQALIEKMQARLLFTRRDARAFARLMFSGAQACTPDAEGRIPLPDGLLQYAGIEGEAVLVGVGTHLELWSPRRWQEVADRMIEEGVTIAEGLRDLGV